METTRPMRSYQQLQVGLFVVGALTLFVALLAPEDALLIVAGACLALSGLLGLLGIRIALRGPLGTLLRGVLEGGPLVKMRIGAVTWLIVGLYLALWGLSRVAQPPPPELPPAHAASTDAA